MTRSQPLCNILHYYMHVLSRSSITIQTYSNGMSHSEPYMSLTHSADNDISMKYQLHSDSNTN